MFLLRFKSAEDERTDSDAATFCPPHKTILFCGDPEIIILRYSWSKAVS